MLTLFTILVIAAVAGLTWMLWGVGVSLVIAVPVALLQHFILPWLEGTVIPWITSLF